MSNTLLDVKNLKKYFPTKKGNLHAVDDVSLQIGYGKTLGIVGESGCGKTTLGRSILRLVEPTSGEIFFEGKNILGYDDQAMLHIRQQMQIVFQDPYSSLNPRMTVSEIIAEPIKVCKTITTQKKIDEKVFELMETVGLAHRFINTYPHELDGGRRQRIGIARALSLNPKFIVCDEPVSALDVSIRAQILNLLMDLQEHMGPSFLFITHDLSVVKHISHEVAVMYLGQIIEKAPSEELFANPLHPYTKALLDAIPIPSLKNKMDTTKVIKGEVTSPIDPKPGCRFFTRCSICKKECKEVSPVLREILPGHFVSCHEV